MAKARMLKPDLRTSEKVASWPIEVRYFWVLLWGYVDDHGKGKDNALLIKSDCFPLDPDITGDQIDQWLDLLAEAGVITRYTVDGTRVLMIINWTEHQKPQHPADSKLPSPDAAGAVSRDPGAVLMNAACTPHEPLTPGFELSRDGFEGGRGDTQAPPAPTQPPSPFCPQHPSGTPSNCRACGDARRARDTWTPPPPPRRPSAWKPGLCLDHLQHADTCEACRQEHREIAEVLHGQFGRISA